MALRIWYVSGRLPDGRVVDGGPFFAEADARAWAAEERLRGVVLQEVTRDA